MTRSIRVPGAGVVLGALGNPIAQSFFINVNRTNLTSAGVIPVTKNTYTAANQPQGDTIEAVSSDGADTTQTITHVGIDGNGNRVEESVALNGATAVATTGLFTYWEFSVLDAVCAGTVTIREGSADQAIASITIGDLVSQVAHLFAGENTFVITYFHPGITTLSGNVVANLRLYSAAASCLAPTSGFVTMETISIFDTEGVVPGPYDYYPLGIPVKPGQYVAVHMTGEGGDDEDVFVTLGGIILPGVATLPAAP